MSGSRAGPRAATVTVTVTVTGAVIGTVTGAAAATADSDPGRRPHGDQPRAAQPSGERRQEDRPGRTVVSFEDDFERGL